MLFAKALTIAQKILKENISFQESCSEMSGKDTWVLEDNYSKYAGEGSIFFYSKCVKYSWNYSSELEMEECPSKKTFIKDLMKSNYLFYGIESY